MNLLAVLQLATSTLPATVGTDVYNPGDAVPPVTIPLLGGGWLDPSSLNHPLVVAATDLGGMYADPFIAYMLGADVSLNLFLNSDNAQTGSTHYLFTSYTSSDAIVTMQTKVAALLSKQSSAVSHIEYDVCV
jgi:hypothetical protein